MQWIFGNMMEILITFMVLLVVVSIAMIVIDGHRIRRRKHELMSQYYWHGNDRHTLH